MSELVEHKIDRTGWDHGPWDREPDKLNWTTAAGLPGMIVRNRLGALCGYVAVTREHAWFGRGYSDGEYPDSPEGSIDVHGGLTYASACRGSICHVPAPGEPDDVWWFGFDCAHSGDYTPESSRRGHGYGYDAYRDVAYVRDEVEKLAAQLAPTPCASPLPTSEKP